MSQYLEQRQRRSQKRDAQGLQRSFHSHLSHSVPYLSLNNKTYLNFSSNDYLGLSQHPLLKAAASAAIQRYGLGAGASRLVTGNASYHDAAEDALVAWKQAPAGLIFASGYQLNSTLIACLADRNSVILLDRLAHQSLIQGAVTSRASLCRFRHNDLGHLRELLAQNSGRPCLVVTESLFSMDGDCAPISELKALCREWGALLLVDEAHASGVYGARGEGLCSVDGDDILVTGTFSKGLGGYGGFVLCSQEWREELISTCPGLIYSTALPPAVMAAIHSAIELVPSLSSERAHLQVLIQRMRQGLSELGFPVLSSTQIQPIIIGEVAAALSLQLFLRERGIWVSAIRPPTVPQGTARLRLTLTSAHSLEQVDLLLASLQELCVQSARVGGAE